MSLWCRSIFYQFEMVENTVGLSGPGRKVHDDLKSAHRRKRARKSEDKRSSRVYGQGSAAEMQLEVDSRTCGQRVAEFFIWMSHD
jgi:hypothetical protein